MKHVDLDGLITFELAFQYSVYITERGRLRRRPRDVYNPGMKLIIRCGVHVQE
jgi:hypothetical protein